MEDVVRFDVSSLRTVVQQLGTSLDYLHSDLAATDPGLRDQFRAATIQAFEFVYELTTKMVRRQLEQDALNPADVRQLGFMALMREAADAGLVTDATRWHGFRELRNRTSHTYDQEEAEEVSRHAPALLEEASTVLERLTERNRA